MGDFYQGERLGSTSDLGHLPLAGGYTHRARETTTSSTCLVRVCGWLVRMLARTLVEFLTGTQEAVLRILGRTGNITETGLTPGRKTGPWRPRVGLVDQHQTLMESLAPGVTTVMTVLSGMRLMVSDTAVPLTATLALWM